MDYEIKVVTSVYDGLFLRIANYFLWFVAGCFFGYIWMANAYGLLG